MSSGTAHPKDERRLRKQTDRPAMRVIGTAGHVDHGKSTLIEALTGTHPDRLKEERERQMTIDLGFGWMTLPDGSEVGIVDVPGHRDFIQNMLAGAAGIDAALLVIASDEGVMPQTAEHIAILDLLNIRTGVIAISKIDLVSDAEWLDALEADVRAAVLGTALAEAPMVRVSAKTQAGLANLKAALAQQLRQQPDRPDLGNPRLALDRMFSMEGFGTVVTGTLTDGQLAVGDDVEILPPGLRGRIRGLQNHNRPVDRAFPGSRTAVNIAGVASGEARRGQVLTHPGRYETSRRFDAKFRYLPTGSAPLRHNDEVKVFIGTCEAMGTLRLLGTDQMRPDTEGMIQIESKESIVCARRDPFILRRPSPPETLGGGSIVNAKSPHRYRRFDSEIMASLDAISAGTSADVLFEAASELGPASLSQIARRAHLEENAAAEAVEELVRRGRLLPLNSQAPHIDGKQRLMTVPAWDKVSQRIERRVSEYHAKFPLRSGLPREEIKSQLKLEPGVVGLIIERKLAEGHLGQRGGSLAMPDHAIRFSSNQEHAIDALMLQFEANPYSPPSMKECKEAVGEEVLAALKELGRLVTLSEQIVFRKDHYDAMVAAIRAELQRSHRITIADVRDLFHTSRRYAQAVLEHLDGIGVTRREGDVHVSAA